MPRGTDHGPAGGGESPSTVLVAIDVQHASDRAGHLPCQRSIIEPGERAQRLEPCGHVVQPVRMQGARAAALMA